jgi:hypothetical protein
MSREIKYKKLQEPAGWRSGNGNLKTFRGHFLTLATAENNQNSNDQKKYCIINFDEKISNINKKHDLLKLSDSSDSKFIDFFIKKTKNNQTFIKENGFLYQIKDEEKRTVKVTKDEPVKIIYKKYKINKDQMEELGLIKEHLNSCIQAEKDQGNNENERDTEEMEEAVKALSNDEISVLQVSDFNTNGAKFNDRGFANLTMKERNKLPWYAILHASGIGAKDDNDDNHGSHGVGKFANFKLSSPRTVLYRSRYSIDNCFSSKEQIKQAFGGRIISRSHELNGKKYGSEANIGKTVIDNDEENLDCVDPYTDPSQFPEFVANEESDETGLDIFIIGSNKLGINWELDVIASTLCKFQIPVMSGDLVVEAGGKVIDKDSILKFYDDEELLNHLKEKGGNILDTFKKAKWYYELFRRDPEIFTDDKYKTKIETLKSDTFGEFTVRMLINNSQNEASIDNPLDKIKTHSLGWFRQGMFICDSADKKPSIIGQMKFHKFPPFFASIECNSSHGIKKFKDRENAKHDDFELLGDEDILKKDFRKFKNLLKDNLRKWICGEEKVSGFGIPELNEIFDGSKNPGNGEKDISNQKKGDEKVKDKSEEDKYSGGITFIPKRKGKKRKKKGKRKGTEIPVITRGKIIELDEELIWRDEKDKNTLIVTVSLTNKKAFKGRVYITTSPSVGSPEPIEIDEVFYGANKCVNGRDYFEDSFKVNARNQYKVKASSLKNSRVFEVILGNLDEVAK